MRRCAQGLQNIVKQLLGSVRQGLPTPQLNIPASHGRRPCVSISELAALTGFDIAVLTR